MVQKGTFLKIGTKMFLRHKNVAKSGILILVLREV